MRPESGVCGESPRLIDQHLWSASDSMASETEIGDFLYGLTRAIKPALAVETGFYKGHSTLKILQALRDNGYGRIVSCDPAGVTGVLRAADYAQLTLMECKSSEIKDIISRCDLLFSDSDTESRMREVSWLKPGAIAVVHDTYSHPVLGEFVKTQGGILFDTPRGFGVIRR